MLFVLLALLAARGDGLRAQWKIVAPKLLPSGFKGAEPQIGAIHIKQGVIWAGVDTLWFSTDVGKTWLKSSLIIEPNNFLSSTEIRDINFFDKKTGVISANGIYLTQDGGQTWKNIWVGRQTTSVVFGKTDSNIFGLEADLGGPKQDQVEMTTDMGNTWETTEFGAGQCLGQALTIGIDGTLYIFSFANPTLNSFINSSSDGGLSWSSNTGNVDGDSYALIADSCSASTLFLAHEGVITSADKKSHLFISTNAGFTWQTTFTDTIGVIAGNMTAGKTAIYAGTMNSSGVLRSLDQGNTWQSIGGPVLNWDSRGIAAMNDDTLFAIDTAGNIWATFNSGGDSITASSYPPDLSVSPASLFLTDTVSCDSLARTVSFTRAFCSPYPDSVEGWSIIGADSMSYSASNLSSDSILVSLYGIGKMPGNQHAQLVLILNNGTSETVPLGGYVNTLPNALTFSTQNVQTDTIGATVSVPITITGLNQTENVNLVLHYDSVLEYQGSFDAANVKLDIPGQQWPGRSELNIPQAQSGMIAGYARFTVFADSVARPQVTFDSLDVLSATSPCEYTLPAPVTSIITPPSGCGTEILSQFLQDSTIPTFSIRPNPTMGEVTLTSSMNFGVAEVEIYDVLGVQHANLTVTLSNDAPAIFSLPDAAGIYYVRINSIAGVRSMSVVVAK